MPATTNLERQMTAKTTSPALAAASAAIETGTKPPAKKRGRPRKTTTAGQNKTPPPAQPQDEMLPPPPAANPQGQASDQNRMKNLPSIPKSIATAVHKATTALHNHPKPEQAHGSDFFAEGIKASVKAGLHIMNDLLTVEDCLVGHGQRQKRGRRFTFAFYLTHKNGDVWNVPLKHAVETIATGKGAGTTALMMAMRDFMRGLFQVFKPGASRETALSIVQSDWVLGVLEQQVSYLNDLGNLEAWAGENKEIFEMLLPPERDKIDNIITAKRSQMHSSYRPHSGRGTTAY